MRGLVFDAAGKVRGLWRGPAFYIVGTWVVFPLLGAPIDWISGRLHLQPGLSAPNILLGEIRNLVVALICTLPFALYERRRIDSYGLMLNRALGWPTFEGAAAGAAMAAAVALGMVAFGGVQIKGFASMPAGGLMSSALLWLVATVCVGLAEEFFYRSYFLQSMWETIGFWPAAVIVALVFAADHYFYKAGENIWDVITLVSLSLVLAYSVLKTGALWFAVGFHFAFDYLQLFVIGTPNGARYPQGRLLDVRFEGPAWLTGGVLGTEASFLMYPAIVLLALYVWWRYRRNPSLRVTPESPPPPAK